MDYKDFLETFSGLACVIAVDLKVEHGDDRYQVVDGNDAYINSVVDSPEKFERNVPYTRYIAKAANFETLCDACANSN